jgi:hypothetical protein
VAALSQARRLPSFNHLVGAGKQRFRHGKAERLSGFEIDHQLILVGRLYRKIGWLLALEDAIDIGGCTPVELVISPSRVSSEQPGKVGIAAAIDGPFVSIRMPGKEPEIARLFHMMPLKTSRAATRKPEGIVSTSCPAG